MALRKKLRGVIALGAAAALAVGLAACSTESPTPEGDGEPTVLNVVRTGSAIQQIFNPYLPVTAFGQGGTGTAGMMIYEPLVQVSTVNAGEFLPWLATEWEWAEDGKSVHFDLREGVTFSDGTPMTSADVVSSYQLIHDVPALNLRGIQFETVEADGDLGVNFTFESNYIHRFDKLVQLEITPAHIYGEIDDVTTFTDPEPVGTGPFMLDTFSNESFLISKNPDYWQEGKPQIDGLQYRTVADNTATAAALVEGSADWGSGTIPNVDQTLIAQCPDCHYFWPVVGSDGLITNNAVFPFNELEVRQAVSLALDRQQVADVAKRQGATSATGLPLPVFENSIADGLKNDTYEYDPEAAVEMLNDIGFVAGGDGILARDGQQLAFTITIPQAFTEQVSAAQVIQAQLAELGIKVDVNGVAVEAIDGITTKGEFQATIGYPIASQILSYNLYDSWMNPKYALPVGEAILTKQNIQRTTGADLQALFDGYLTATSDEERLEIEKGLQQYFIDNVPWIVLSYYQTAGQWSEAKATGWPTEDNPYWVASPSPVVAIELVPNK
jgi:peptide/nickel transport system substrate-binding protein